MSLVDDAPVENTPNQDSQDRPQSFRERAKARLAEESDSKAQSFGTPEQFQSESAEDEHHAESPEGEYDDYMELAESEDTADESDLIDDETPEEEAPEDESEGGWESRYKEAQAELTRTKQQRAEEREEIAQATETNIRLRHHLEDQVAVAEKHSQFFSNLLNRQVTALEQKALRPELTVEDKAKLNQQYQIATNQRDQMTAALKQIEAEGKMALEKAKMQEADTSKAILNKTIPNWGREVFGEIQGHAVDKYGFTPEEVANITDHRWIRVLNDSLQSAQAVAKVKEVKRQGKKRPPKRGATPQQRNAQGRYQSTLQAARERKVPMREVFKARLEMDRKGRR